jgi:hypothetical protein
MYPMHYLEYFRVFDREKKIFVAMPFAEAFNPRWNQIFVPAIRSLDLEPFRVDESFVSDSILTDILKGIGSAKLIIVDISADECGYRNGNVMYELGIAHSIRMPEEVIIVCCDKKISKHLFDINQIRINYFNENNIEESVEKVIKLLKNSIKEIDLTKDILISKVLRSLDPACYYVLNVLKKSISAEDFKSPPDADGSYGPLSNREARRAFFKLQEHGILEPPFADVDKDANFRYRFTSLGEAIRQRISYTYLIQ